MPHVEQPPRSRPVALVNAAALPRAGLPSHGREACQAGDRLGVEAAECRHLVSRPAVVTRDTPGIDVRISVRRASPSSTASLFPIVVLMAARCRSS